MVDISHLTESIVGCATEVHRQLRPGLLEGTYEEALCLQRQLMVPVIYKGRRIGEYRLHLLVGDLVVVEIKSASMAHQLSEGFQPL